jgi:hypothetical protein
VTLDLTLVCLKDDGRAEEDRLKLCFGGWWDVQIVYEGNGRRPVVRRSNEISVKLCRCAIAVDDKDGRGLSNVPAISRGGAERACWTSFYVAVPPSLQMLT